MMYGESHRYQGHGARNRGEKMKNNSLTIIWLLTRAYRNNIIHEYRKERGKRKLYIFRFPILNRNRYLDSRKVILYYIIYIIICVYKNRFRNN